MSFQLKNVTHIANQNVELGSNVSNFGAYGIVLENQNGHVYDSILSMYQAQNKNIKIACIRSSEVKGRFLFDISVSLMNQFPVRTKRHS